MADYFTSIFTGDEQQTLFKHDHRQHCVNTAISQTISFTIYYNNGDDG